jgi:hypothetical protein
MVLYDVEHSTIRGVLLHGRMYNDDDSAAYNFYASEEDEVRQRYCIMHTEVYDVNNCI